jgi:hypothetical protein
MREAAAEISSASNLLSVESDKTSLEDIERETNELVDLGCDRFLAVEQSGIPQSQLSV